ncbi:MAG: MASE3 domain-containing protein, partial [Nitrospirota bacterium]|nr:MASE3 domain-containing protein [Nitrospirota bacterium]
MQMERNKKIIHTLPVLIAAAALYASSLYNYLLFHSIVEIFSIVIAAGIFVIAWNTRNFSPNPYLLFIGISYLYVASMYIFHTICYKGMVVFAGGWANLSTQLWICGRYMQSISLLAAPYFIGRKLKIIPVFILYFLVSAGLLLSIYYGLFPETFIEGKGLTMFKIISEYVISLILVLAIIYLRKKRGSFDKPVLNLLIWSLITTIASEMAFTLYTDAYGFFNTLGHYFKIASYYLIYAAIIKTNLKKPYESMVR